MVGLMELFGRNLRFNIMKPFNRRYIPSIMLVTVILLASYYVWSTRNTPANVDWKLVPTTIDPTTIAGATWGGIVIQQDDNFSVCDIDSSSCTTPNWNTSIVGENLRDCDFQHIAFQAKTVPDSIAHCFQDSVPAAEGGLSAIIVIDDGQNLWSWQHTEDTFGSGASFMWWFVTFPLLIILSIAVLVGWIAYTVWSEQRPVWKHG